MRDRELTRRRFLSGTTAAGTALALSDELRAADGPTTITILHTNDLHSNLIGVGPASEYTPATLNDDKTIGGIDRIAGLIAERKRVQEARGPVLVLDAGDFSIGTAFGGAMEQLGAELQCLSLAGYDATTIGNHDLDVGPAGLARSITAAREAGRLPPIVASNTNADADDAGLSSLKGLMGDGAIRRHVMIERGGLRFGLFGMMGPDSIQYTINPGALTFTDAIETAREMVDLLRAEGADVIICLSHGGVKEPREGPITGGDDVRLAEAVPGIDVIVGGHTHTFMQEPVVVNGTPIVQAGCYGQTVGELVLQIEGGSIKVVSHVLHRVDDTIQGDAQISNEMTAFTAAASRIVFEPRGLELDEPFAVIDRDWTNTFFDLKASRPLGNLTADAIRFATKADVALNAAGMVRAGLPKGESGVQTAYDVFLLAPLGIGVKDHSAGGSLIVAYLTGREIKNCLEFLLVGNPNLPGQYFPRVSGMRFRYDPSRPRFDTITEIELGDLDRGYLQIDISEGAEALYSVGCNLYFGLVLASIGKTTGGALSLVPKTRDGERMQSRADALPTAQSGPFLLPSKGSVDPRGAVRVTGATTAQEIKEWQAIMEYLRSRSTKDDRGVTVLAIDERTMEDRSINMRD